MSTTSVLTRILVNLGLAAGLLWISHQNYLLFHSLAELFSIIIAFSIFILAWSSQRFLRNGYLLFIGIAFFYVAGVDLIHTLAYQGMGVFPNATANLPTQLWLVARYVQASMLLVAPMMLNRRPKPVTVLVAYGAVTLALLLSIFAWDLFPTAYIDGSGLTPFKIYSEYVIILLLAFSTAWLWRIRQEFHLSVARLLVVFLLLSIASELAFTTYVSVYAPANAIGHLLKIQAFYFLYQAILVTGFERPMSLLFHDLGMREAELQRVNQSLERELQIRRQVEYALRQSESRLRRLAESNILGVFYFNTSGVFRQANRYFLNLLGYSDEDMRQGRVLWHELTPVDLRDADRRGLEEAEQRGACTPYETEYLHKSGARVPVLIGYAKIEGSDDLIGFLLDLTDRRLAEQAMADYAHRLERSNRELEEFAFVASHDLQEPLRKIQTFGDRLNEKLSTRLSDEENDYLRRMLNAASRMRKMINDLLSLSRVTTQAQPFEVVDLNQVAADVISDLELTIERSHGRVLVEPLPVIEADPLQIRQLLTNLLSNALKFRHPDIDPVVTVSSGDVEDGQTQLWVSDNGIGFDEANLDRIFLPFQRLHGKSQYEGSGVGLAICRKIVERHGGRLTAKSQPGAGSRFIVTFPAPKRDEAYEKHASETTDSRRRG